MLFDLSKDIGEQNNLASDHPEIVDRLQQRMKQLDDEITMNARRPWFKKRENRQRDRKPSVRWFAFPLLVTGLQNELSCRVN